MRWGLYIGCMLLVSISTRAQVITLPYEEQFEWQVKQIDEFMDRFNNAEQTPIRQFLQDRYAIDKVKRTDMLMTLFNHQKAWDTTQVRRFLRDVAAMPASSQLHFYDMGWYAALECSGLYEDVRHQFTLILTLKTNPQRGTSRWVVSSVSAGFLPDTDTVRAAFPLPNTLADQPARTLNPASFGTDFMGLVSALQDRASFGNYINLEVADGAVTAFFNLLYEQKLQFRQVNHITYHFLQVPGWVFTVENFSRQSSNSGWLINALMAVPEAQKVSYKKNNLFLTQH